MFERAGFINVMWMFVGIWIGVALARAFPGETLQRVGAARSETRVYSYGA